MKYIFSLIAMLAIFFVSAQDTTAINGGQQVAQDSVPFELRRQAYIYGMSKKYNDPAVARMALYNILSTSPNSTPILDSLALSYFDYQQYASAALVAQDAISINPNDLFATEIAAISFDNLGVKSRAVDFYEKLYLENNNLGTLYRIAFLQYELNRFGEATNNTENIISNDESDELKLLFQKSQNENQEVSLKAATYRLKGMIAEAQGNTDEAKQHYEKALELEPEFAAVKQQLQNLQ